MASHLRRLALYGPLGKVAGRKLVKLRESRGWAESTAATKLGVNLKSYRKLEDGALVLSPEIQRRVLRLYFGATNWDKTPTLPARPVIPKGGRPVQVDWYDAELWQKTAHYALTHGVSMSAVVAAAMERFLLDEPALVTIKAAMDAYERMRTESILAANPDLVYILKGDIAAAKLASMVDEVPAEYHPDLKNWKAVWDGPASPVAGAELENGWLAPATDGEDDGG